MADLRTDSGRDRRGWRYALLVLLAGFAVAPSIALAQSGPELTGPTSYAAGQAATPPAAEPPRMPSHIAPPPKPAGPTPNEALAAASPNDVVADVRIAGIKTLPLSKVLPHIRTRKGRPYNTEMIQEDVRRLENTHLFISVRPFWQQTPNGRIVVFELIERPLLREVLFVGCKEIHKKRLRKEADIKEKDPADPSTIEGARRKIEDYYHQKGFNNATVTLLEGSKPEDRRAIFLIDEGTKQQIFSFDFVGNKIASGGRLKTQIKSKTPFLWLFGGELDRKQLDEDVQRLTAYYRGLGFFRARIGREMEFNEKQNWVTVRFVIDEGPRYKVRNVSVIGNTKYTSDELMADLKLGGGDYFNQAKMMADKNSISDKYGSVGYVFADIRPDPRFLEEPAQLDLVYNIKEGDRYRVGKINVLIKGEVPHTQLTTVLNRLSIKPGDIVDIREIRASERRLKASQLFETNPQTGNAPKITFSPPGQEPLPDDDAVEKPRDKGGRRAMGRGGPEGGPLFRGQSPDNDSRDRDLTITLDCGRYIGPQDREDPGARGQGLDGSGLANARPLQGAGDERPAAVASDGLWQAARDLNEALAHETKQRPGLILTQYSPDAGQVNPAARAADPNSRYRYAGQSQSDSSAAAAGQADANANGNTSGAGQATSVAPAPAYGQQMWPSQAPQRPVDSPDGPYTPGPIFSENSPFRDGPPDGGGAVPFLPFGVNTEETMTGRIMVGVGVNSDAGLVGSVVLDEQNFDWTRWPRSWEDIRNGTAWRGAGQRFRLEAAPGIATSSNTQPVSRYMVTFQEPYLFNTQVSLGLNGYYYNRIFTQYTDTRVGGRIALGYQFTPDLSGGFAYRGAKINITNPIDPDLPALAEVVNRDLALHGFQASLTLDKRDNAFMATEGYLIEGSFEEVLGSFQYPHAELDVRKYFMVHERPDGSGRHVLSLSSRVGFTGDNTPIYERYYAGGFSSLRGFEYRGVSPIEIGPSTGYDIAVGGDFLLLASAEYLFPITADDMLRGVVFCDTGTVEPTAGDWSNNYRVAPGFGLRIVVPAMGPAPIALDFAFPICWNTGDQRQVFSFFVGFGR